MNRACHCLATTILLSLVPVRALSFDTFQVQSANGQYLAEVKQGESDSMIVTVLRQEASATTIQWAARLEAPSYLNDPRVSVTDDGQCAVVESHFPHEPLALAFLGQKGLKRIYSAAELMSLLGERRPIKPASVPAGVDWPADLDAATRWSDESCVRLFDVQDGEWLFCLWLSSKNDWLAWYSGTGDEIKVTAPQRERWHQKARAWAQERVRASQAGRFLGMVKKAADRATGLLSPPSNPYSARRPYSSQDLQDAYKYLARRKVPEDRKWIEALLTSQDFSAIHGLQGGLAQVNSLVLYSEERKLGDYLLATWEGKWPEDRRPPRDWGSMDGDYTYLSKVQGTLELPLPATHNDGSLWIYLIPAAWSADEWKRIPPPLTIKADLTNMLFGFTALTEAPNNIPEPEDTKEIHFLGFGFEGVTPGRYRLKAVWDKQPPFAGEDAKSGLPESGDYESAPGPVLDLAAGQAVEDVILACTNRIGTDMQRYSADEQKIRQFRAGLKADGNAEATDDERFKLRSNSRGVPAVEFPFSPEHSNDNSGPIRLRKVTFGRRHKYYGHEQLTEGEALVVWFTERADSREELLRPLPQIEAVDEHGCKPDVFASLSGKTSGDSGAISFAELDVFPRRQPSFRLHFVQGTVVTEYQVTNVSHPEFPFWKADPEPYEKRVAGMDVSLDLRRVGIQAVQNLESWTPRFHFARNGQTTTNWQAEEIIFEDATGNKAHSLTELCRQEEVVKVSAKLFRKREAEFSPEETWSIPDLVVPEPGKAVALSLSNRLQGVTLHVLAIAGVGETTYSNNVPVAATAQISIDTRPRAESVWIDHPGRRPNADSLPSVFIKSSGPDDLMPAFTFVGRSDVKPLTVVSGVPHVAVSVKGLDNERRVFLKGSEEIRSSYFPVQGSRRPNEPYFLPLKDTVASKKLTLVFAVQKSVKVEFFVKTPPRQVPEK